MSEISEFLVSIKAPEEYALLFESQKIREVEILREHVKKEDLISYGISVLWANIITQKIVSYQPRKVEQSSCNSNELQLALFKKELEIEKIKKEAEHESRIRDMEHKNALKDKETESKFALMAAQHARETETIKAEMKHNSVVQDLKREIVETKFQGELEKKELEIKRLNEKPAVNFPYGTIPPTWWPSTFPWGNIPFNFPFPGSTVIDQTHYLLIQFWLPSPRLWTFRFRASSYAFSAASFHSLCDGHGPTIIVVKSTGGYLFGAYNPHSWNSTPAYQTGAGSFLFTLTNPRGNPPTKFNSSKNSHGPHCHPSSGPSFGGGHDLHLSNNNVSNYSNFGNSYQDTLGYGENTFTGSRNFQVTDYEVYSLRRSSAEKT